MSDPQITIRGIAERINDLYGPDKGTNTMIDLICELIEVACDEAVEKSLNLDKIACSALNGLLSNSSLKDKYDNYAKQSYEFAYAMRRERKNGEKS